MEYVGSVVTYGVSYQLRNEKGKEIEEKAENFRMNCLHYSDVYSEIEEKIKYLLNKDDKEKEIKEFIDSSFKKILNKKK